MSTKTGTGTGTGTETGTETGTTTAASTVAASTAAASTAAASTTAASTAAASTTTASTAAASTATPTIKTEEAKTEAEKAKEETEKAKITKITETQTKLIKKINEEQAKLGNEPTYKDLLDFLNLIPLSDNSYNYMDEIKFKFEFPKMTETDPAKVKQIEEGRKNLQQIFREATGKELIREIVLLGDLLELILVLLIPNFLIPETGGQDNESIKKQNNDLKELRRQILFELSKAITNSFETDGSRLLVQIKFITNMTDSLQKLVEADILLGSTIRDIKNSLSSANNPGFIKKLDKLSQNFGKLQGFILLERIRQRTPKEKPASLASLMEPLVDAVNNKLETVNEMLFKGLQRVTSNNKYFQNLSNKYTETIDPYYNKYLKYKSKYLALKNN